jgi:hypothetical protein
MPIDEQLGSFDMEEFTHELDTFSFKKAPPNYEEFVRELVARVVVQEQSVSAELDGIAASHDIDKASSAGDLV